MTHPYSSRFTTKCCYSCEEDGHLSRDCPNKKPRLLTNMFEYHGQEFEDMMAKVLPMKSKKNRGDVTCCHCKNKGNFASDCPEKKNQNLSNNVPRRDISQVTCFKCRYKGHYANECPENKDNTPNP